MNAPATRCWSLGDLALAGLPLLGAFRSVRGGHKLNHAALTALLADRSAWRVVEGEAARRPASGRGRRAAWSAAWWPRPTARTCPEAGAFLKPSASDPNFRSNHNW